MSGILYGPGADPVQIRVDQAAETVTQHALAAAGAGPLTTGRRVLLGEQALMAYIEAEKHELPFSRGELASVLTSMTVGLLHLANGHLTPKALRELAAEQLATAANQHNEWIEAGGKATAALTASALASLLAYGQALTGGANRIYGSAEDLWLAARQDRDPYWLTIRPDASARQHAEPAPASPAGVEIIVEPGEYDNVVVNVFVNGVETDELPDGITIVQIGTDNPDADWRESMELDAQGASPAAAQFIRERINAWTS